MAANVQRGSRADAVFVQGLDDFRKELARLDKQLNNGGRKALKEVNFDVANFVVNKSRSAATSFGSMDVKAMKSLKASKTQAEAKIMGGGTKYPMFGGSEFGAYQNRKRLIKNTKGRATIVRNNENIDKVIRRVESQTVIYDRRGAPTTVRKKARDSWGGTAVKVEGIMLGWNQFRPWRGNKATAGYIIYPTLRSSTPDIIGLYADGFTKLLSKVFPD